MSGMRDMLRIALDRDAPPHHEPNERGNCRSGRYHPEKLPLSFRALREDSSAAWIDSQDLTHVAHAYDPWVLDARSVRNGHPRRGVHPSRPEGSDT